MKRISILFTLALLVVIPAMAEDPQPEGQQRRFSPQEFMKKQEGFIIREAGLSSAEAAKFFPVFHELGKKNFDIDRQIKQQARRGSDPSLSEKEAVKVLAEIDRLQLAKAKLNSTYHQKFRKILSAKKTLKVIEADAKFGRVILKQMSFRRGPWQKQRHQQKQQDGQQ